MCERPRQPAITGQRQLVREHRLVYRADDKEVKILKARYHCRD
jgi:Txe/YoeB family toxin of Txe-Axe toxin-antitoxin module